MTGGDLKCGKMALPGGCSECQGFQPFPSLQCLISGGGGEQGLAASPLAVLEGSIPKCVIISAS